MKPVAVLAVDNRTKWATVQYDNGKIRCVPFIQIPELLIKKALDENSRNQRRPR